MDEAEQRSRRREILIDMARLFIEELSADDWGRVLVAVHQAEGGWEVTNIDVEEIVGDEHRVDRAFGAPSMRALLPVIAKATEALAALEGVDLAEVGGGTFVRLREGGFHWLPGLVRVPSMAFDRVRDEAVAREKERLEALRARLGELAGFTVDLERGELRLGDGTTARVALVGTYARAARTFAWGWSNRTLGEVARRRSAALTDAVKERDIWEVSTPYFATDEATAYALAAFVCDRAGGAAVLRAPHEDGTLFFMVE